jgi:thiol-disulfide isomerase/thioredoxin
MHRQLLVAAILVGLAPFRGSVCYGQEPKAALPGEAGPPVVKYEVLAREVVKRRGKVVVVNFWCVFSTYCFRDFIYLAAMRKEFTKDGLVIVNVNVDYSQAAPADKARLLPLIRRVAKDKCDGLNNLVLDETLEVIEQKLRFTSPPCVYVFDRKGRWHLLHFMRDDVRPLVRRLLKEDVP